MSYATVDDVKNFFFNKEFGVDSNISTSKVTFFLESAETLIKSKIQIVATLPITNVDDLKRLKMLESKIAAGYIDDMENSGQRIKLDEKITKRRDLNKEAMQELEDIVSEKSPLNSNILSNVSGGEEDLDLEDLGQEDIGQDG